MLTTLRTTATALAAATALCAALPAAAAHAEECEPLGVSATLRTDVVAQGGRALVLGSGYTDEDMYGDLDDGAAGLYELEASGRASRGSLTLPNTTSVAPALLTGRTPMVLQWRRTRETGNTDLVLSVPGSERIVVPGLPFTGYRDVAAAAAPDGAITFAYGVGGGYDRPAKALFMRRLTADGVLGAAQEVPVAGGSVANHLAVDRQGTAFLMVPGASGGVTVRWPATGPPEIARAPGLVSSDDANRPARVLADGKGGAWLRLLGQGDDRRVDDQVVSLAHLTPAGLTVTRVAGGLTRAAGPVVAPDGTATLAFNGREPYVQLRRVGLDGGAAAATRLRGTGLVSALALDPRSGTPAVLKGNATGDALVLQRSSGSSIVLRRRAGYTQGGASLAFTAGGRAYAVWEETSRKADEVCGGPAVAAVRWATLAPGAKTAKSRVLERAGIVRSFS